MQLKRLSLFNFRNYSEATLNFSEGIHIIHGENGAGKTSILEAIHYLGLTKSFRTTTDKHLIRHDEAMF
ncbi:MAG: AAA family ATPase, partial [Calditrichota bacterium]